MQTFVMGILQKSFEMDKPLTPELQNIVNMYFQKEQQKQLALQQQAEQQAQQEAMAQQQAQQQG
jgi:hypothetical protein